MLEFFTYKKVKKHREQKAAGKEKEAENGNGNGKENEKEKATEDDKGKAEGASPQIISTPPEGDDDGPAEGTPVLDREDEKFLERLTSADASLYAASQEDDTPPPPLPPRVKTPVIDIDSDTSSMASQQGQGDKDKDKYKDGGESKPPASDPKAKGKEKESSSPAKPKRFTFSLRRKPVPPSRPASAPGLAVPQSEAAAEQTDLARVLDDLDLSAKNNRAFSLSSESADMARRFTQVLKDLVNGVPTAYGDLVSLLDDRDGVLARTFEKLPSGLKKLVAQLPEKLTSSLAPELLAAAAEAQGLDPAKGAEGGLKDAAKRFLTPATLHELVTKPGALAGLLKGIVNALKTRFPAFVGTNVLWSLAVFLLLSVLWYCYKRGREVRLEREASEAADKQGKADDDDDGDANGNGEEEIEGRPRVEELPDDPMLAATPSSAAAAART